MNQRSRPRWFSVVKTPVGATAAALLAVIALLTVFAPMLWGERADAVDSAHLLAGSSADHWLGTDGLGRDVLARVLVATRLSVGLALCATAIGVGAGLLLGGVPILLGRRVGRMVHSFVGVAVAFPGLLLALFFAVIFGAGERGAVLAIGLAVAPGFARLVQTLVSGVEALDYVAAARTLGAGRVRILLRHVLPNIAEPLIINAAIAAGNALLAFAGLSFLGLGVTAPSYDWGLLLSEGLSRIYIHPTAAVAPGVAVVLAGLAFNQFGETLATCLRQDGSGFAGATGPARPQTGTESASAAAAEEGAVLVAEDLRVVFPAAEGHISPVRGVGFRVGHGEAIGVVGESGSGKSLTALAIARLLEEPARTTAARLDFDGTSLLLTSVAQQRTLLGTSFAMVFQDPLTSFNPTRRIGHQLAEVAREHQGMRRRPALTRAVDRLRAVGIAEPERRASAFPHELSGGMRQRAMIGLGLMGTPRLLVADEPTTALDVTVQRQVLDLLADVRAQDSVALLLISHDIAVVEQACDRVLVMYAGRIVEELPAAGLRTRARHPYTRALVDAVPDMTTDRSEPLAVIPGQPVDPADVPAGCAFAARCPRADRQCTAREPALSGTGTDTGKVACWHPFDARDPSPHDRATATSGDH